MVDQPFFGRTIGECNIFSDMYPRAFSFSTVEDALVQQFLSAHRLVDNFHLPLSPEALEETRNLQANVAHLLMEAGSHDKWIYDWGSDV
jgi:hypothetical protein